MVLPIAFILGVFFGISRAKKRNGNRFDMAHYGATYGIVFVLLTLFGSIVMQRMGLLL